MNPCKDPVRYATVESDIIWCGLQPGHLGDHRATSRQGVWFWNGDTAMFYRWGEDLTLDESVGSPQEET